MSTRRVRVEYALSTCRFDKSPLRTPNDPNSTVTVHAPAQMWGGGEPIWSRRRCGRRRRDLLAVLRVLTQGYSEFSHRATSVSHTFWRYCRIADSSGGVNKRATAYPCKWGTPEYSLQAGAQSGYSGVLHEGTRETFERGLGSAEPGVLGSTREYPGVPGVCKRAGAWRVAYPRKCDIISIYLSSYLHVCIYMCVCVCVCVAINSYKSAYPRKLDDVSIYLCTHLYVCIFIHAYNYIYIPISIYS